MRRVMSTLAAGALLAAPAAAPAAERVPVAIVGDSIVEASHPGLPEGDGLLPRLRAELARRGLDPGAGGFVASHPAQLAPVQLSAPPSGPWDYEGAWAWLTRAYGIPSPLVSWTANAEASASLPAPQAEHATLLYLRGPLQGAFTFRAGAATAEVQGDSAELGVGMRTLPLPRDGDRTIEVTDARDGGIGLIGAFLRREPRPGRTQVELTAIAAGGAQAADPTSAAEDAGLAALRPRLTVIILGTNDGIGYARSRDPAALDALREGLARRGARAAATGACLIAPPARAHFPADVHAAIRAEVRAAARASGCRQLPILAALDRDPSLTVDGVHPSSAGYARLAAALAPRVARVATDTPRSGLSRAG
ncbi:MAG TPA: GDSL-type esterase/lipase family protein [Capillimicrobium sp.]|jgi:lysophospholipase L1-like esterase